MIYTKHLVCISHNHKIVNLLAALFMFLTALPDFSMAGTVSLPQTGQTTCYAEAGTIVDCAGTKQDGDIQAGVAWPSPRFTDNGDGTITDDLTGLVWAQDADLPDGAMIWQEALDYVAGMNAGTYSNFGYTDWHLPNVNELESLVNTEEADTYTWLNSQGFANVQSDDYWSSTTSAGYAGSAWYVRMGNGRVNSERKADVHSYSYVWPVRAGSGGSFGNSDIRKTGQTESYAAGDDGDVQAGAVWPDPRFTDNGDSTVTDNLTGLVWSQESNHITTYSPSFDNEGDSDGKVSWQHALDYVEGMNAGIYENFGYTDWLLPNRKELLSLIDYSQVSPPISAGHPFTNAYSWNMIWPDFWSSTNSAYNTYEAWIIGMSSAYLGDMNKAYGCFVWPVRAGSGGSLDNSDISVYPASHNFGNVTVGDSSSQTFTATNKSDADLVIDTISLTGTDSSEFSIQNDSCSDQTVTPSDTCTVEVLFAPTSEDDKVANLSVSSIDPDTPIQEVSLSGNGIDLDSEGGYLTTSDLWIRAVINTEEKGDIDAVWHKGGEDITDRGDRVIWGYFYANPNDVDWGSQDNPELFVKIWFDVSSRIDVNYFHVSVPNIVVYSDYPYDGTYDESSTTTISDRYVRQYYEKGISQSEIQYEDGISPSGYFQSGNPAGYSTINNLKIGSMINTEEKGLIEAIWQLGGLDTTSRGDEVVWGHFYASPDDVSWGSQDNPELFVKIWFDAEGRIDTNFFHVSVPDIEVYSDYPDSGRYDQEGTTMMSDRYTRQEY